MYYGDGFVTFNHYGSPSFRYYGVLCFFLKVKHGSALQLADHSRLPGPRRCTVAFSNYSLVCCSIPHYTRCLVWYLVNALTTQCGSLQSENLVKKWLYYKIPVSREQYFFPLIMLVCASASQALWSQSAGYVRFSCCVLLQHQSLGRWTTDYRPPNSTTHRDTRHVVKNGPVRGIRIFDSLPFFRWRLNL